MTTPSYRSPEAFRGALEQRIRTAATKAGVPMNRFRQLLVFERFLVRVLDHFGDQAIVKGGLVLELRLERARTTKDVDLRLVGDPSRVLEDLRTAGANDQGDWLSFLVEPDPEWPVIKGDGMVYDGMRFRGEAQLGGKLYGDPFGIDVGFADVLTTPPDVVEGGDFFEFIGLTRPRIRTLAPGSFIRYGAVWDFVSDLDAVAAEIEKVATKDAARRVKLFETFTAACHEKAEEIDDSSASFGTPGHFASARRCYERAGLGRDWNKLVAAVRTAHSRKSGFIGGFERLVSGQASAEPSFLERARSRWVTGNST